MYTAIKGIMQYVHYIQIDHNAMHDTQRKQYSFQNNLLWIQNIFVFKLKTIDDIKDHEIEKPEVKCE